MKFASLLLVLVLGLVGCAPTVPALKSAAAPPEARRLGYHLSGSQVVFEFRPGEFTEVTSGAKPKWSKLSELRIHSVSVAGEFNRWSTTAWPMALAGDQWITTHAIADFNPDRPLGFKFVINGEFWVEPPAQALNRAPVPDSRLANLMLELHHADAPAETPTH
jgi:hypothetical protein